MTNEQKIVVDGLKHCATHEFCEGCPAKETCYPRDDMLIGLAVDMIVQMAADLEQLKRERDALLHEAKAEARCYTCKNHRSEGGECFGVGMCGHNHPEWEWRGPCAENGG